MHSMTAPAPDDEANLSLCYISELELAVTTNLTLERRRVPRRYEDIEAESWRESAQHVKKTMEVQGIVQFMLRRTRAFAVRVCIR
jgi:hypothetical protein